MSLSPAQQLGVADMFSLVPRLIITLDVYRILIPLATEGPHVLFWRIAAHGKGIVGECRSC